MPSMNLILAVPSGWYSKAGACGFTKAHMIYRAGQDCHLYRAEAPASLRGGIMGVCEIGCGENGLRRLAGEMEAECSRRGYSGIIICGDKKISQSLTEPLSAFTKQRGMKLYLPESAGFFPGHSRVLISTAISGGSLNKKLTEAKARFKAIALDIERMRTDYTLPAKQDGVSLSAAELQELMRRCRPKAFFSKELCTYYFTYRAQNRTHLVLYDNAASISAKLRLGKSLGIEEAFILYPEVEDILSEISTFS